MTNDMLGARKVAEPEEETQDKEIGEVRPVVFMLGDFRHEGLNAKIESLGFEQVNKRLRSSPKNWLRIVELIRQLRRGKRLAATFLYVPTGTLLDLTQSEYAEARASLLAELEVCEATVFVHESTMEGVVEPYPWDVRDWNERYGHSGRENSERWMKTYEDPSLPSSEEWLQEHAGTIEVALQLLRDMAERGLTLAPFRTRADVTIRIFEALEEAQAGVFLRLYVPHGRYQSEQLEAFLSLFSRYMREVERADFSIDSQRTARGTTYVFKGRGDTGTFDDLQAATKRLDSFLALALADPVAAEREISLRGSVPASQAAAIVATYTHALRRLNVDARHEYARRRLALEQTLELDVLEAAARELCPAPEESKPSSLLSVAGNSGSVTINMANSVLGSQNIADLSDVTSKGTGYSDIDRAILELIAHVPDKSRAVQLRSYLDSLRDAGTSPDARRTAAQKLKSLIYTSLKFVTGKVDEIGTKVVVAYLEGLAKQAQSGQ